jgi:hypothetical protein
VKNNVKVLIPGFTAVIILGSLKPFLLTVGYCPIERIKPSTINLQIETITRKTCEFEVVSVLTVNIAVFGEVIPWSQVRGAPKFKGSFLSCHELTRMQQLIIHTSKGTAPHTGRHQSV